MDGMKERFGRINEEIKALEQEINNNINNAKELSDLEAIIEFLNMIKENPSFAHISSKYEAIVEEKKKSLSVSNNKSVSWFDEKGYIKSKYLSDNHFPSFIPYRYQFFMIHALWYLAHADAKSKEEESTESFNKFFDSMMRFLKDDKDKKEYLDFFTKMASNGGLLQDLLPQLIDKVNNYTINPEKTTKYINELTNPYKDINLDLSFIDDKMMLNNLKRKMTEFSNTEAYGLLYYYQFKTIEAFNNEEKEKDLERQYNSNEATINNYINYILKHVKDSSNLEELKNVFSQFESGYGRRVYEQKILPFIEEKEKTLTTENKFKSNNSEDKNFYVIFRRKCEILLSALNKICNREYKSKKDLDDIYDIIGQYQSLDKELDSMHNKISREEFNELADLIKQNINTAKIRHDQLEEFFSKMSRIDFSL